MHYRLREGLSYCVSDGIAVFLDIDTDRYFRLPAAPEHTFLRYAQGCGASAGDLEPLVARRILEPSSHAAPVEAPPWVPVPARSALELPVPRKKAAAPAIPKVLLTTWSVHRQIQAGPLKAVLGRAVRHRQVHLQSKGDRHRSEDGLLECAHVFRHARRHVPIPTRCLLDSLALTRFLARRGQASTIVFGVSHEPFSAHCWVQVGDLVLNDTVGSVLTHTPIKVI